MERGPLAGAVGLSGAVSHGRRGLLSHPSSPPYPRITNIPLELVLQGRGGGGEVKMQAAPTPHAQAVPTLLLALIAEPSTESTRHHLKLRMVGVVAIVTADETLDGVAIVGDLERRGIVDDEAIGRALLPEEGVLHVGVFGFGLDHCFC